MTDSTSKPNPWIAYLIVALVGLTVLAVGLDRFGFWEGAELQAAGVARDATLADPQMHPPAQTVLARFGFHTFGAGENGGRLPGALLAVIAALALTAAVARVSDLRAGVFAGIAYATMPLVFVNARQILGGGVAQSCATLGFSAVMVALWGRPPKQGRALQYLLLLGALIGAWGAGWMLGVVPVLVGAGITLLLRWRDESPTDKAIGVALTLAGAVLGALCVRAAVHPREAYSALLGVGADARGGTLPTFDALIETLGHSLFPWTGLAAFGALRLIAPPPVSGVTVGDGGKLLADEDAWREAGLRHAAFVTLAVAYGLQSFHLQQFGASPFVVVAPLAVGVGILLRDAERESRPWRVVAAGTTFLTALMARDFLLFPKSAYSSLGLADGGPAFPVGASSGRLSGFFSGHASAEAYFGIEALLFIVIALPALFLGAGRVEPIAWDRPYRWLIDLERRAHTQLVAERAAGLGGLGHIGLRFFERVRIYLGVLAVLVMASAGAGLASPHLLTPVKIALLICVALPAALVAVIYLFIALWNAMRVAEAPDPEHRGAWSRLMLVPVAGVLVAMVIGQLFIPALSRHLSPRDVWLHAARLRQPDESVARFGGPPNDPAPHFYTNFEVQSLANEQAAVDWLSFRSNRHYLVVNAGNDVFPSLNRAYRRSQAIDVRHNIPVIDASNSNLYLAASDAPDGSHNPLDEIVMTTDTLRTEADHFHLHGRYEGSTVIPEPARLDDAIEYIGYNLDTGGHPYVPIGSSIGLTYHFHVLREVQGNQQVFVHIDGPCPRTNGDHDPAGGRYPVRFWVTGDYVHDETRVTIPAWCRPGRYQAFIGFFQGDNRMHVQGGDHDHENRIIAATLDVR